MKFMKKKIKNKTNNSGGCEEWKCALCDHVFKGSYTRVWHYLLNIFELGVKGFTCSLEQRMRMTKLHMKASGNNECDSSIVSPTKRGRHEDSSKCMNEQSHIQIETIQRILVLRGLM